MTRPSSRKRLLSQMEQIIALKLITEYEENDHEEDLDQLLLNYSVACDARYLTDRGRQHRRTDIFFSLKLPELSKDEFRSIFRMTEEHFLTPVDTLAGNPVFHNNSYNEQAHPARQIAVALARLGSNGNASSVSRIRLCLILVPGLWLPTQHAWSRRWWNWHPNGSSGQTRNAEKRSASSCAQKGFLTVLDL
ncbi:hypothetical protein BG004_001726 [Podila humilis]|nr:hypothetical protein BG004_001726 [Podila humilis]